MNRHMIDYATRLGEIVVPKTQGDLHQSKRLGKKIMAGGFKPDITCTSGFYWFTPQVSRFTPQVLPQPQARVPSALSIPGPSIHGHAATDGMYPGVSSCLLDHFLGPLFTLVGVGAATAPALKSPLPPFVSRLLLLQEGEHAPQVVAAVTESGDESVIRYATLPKDLPTDTFAPLCEPGTVLLVRPDRYVYGAVNFRSCGDMLRHFQEHLKGENLQGYFHEHSCGPIAVAARL